MAKKILNGIFSFKVGDKKDASAKIFDSVLKMQISVNKIYN